MEFHFPVSPDWLVEACNSDEVGIAFTFTREKAVYFLARYGAKIPDMVFTANA